MVVQNIRSAFFAVFLSVCVISCSSGGADSDTRIPVFKKDGPYVLYQADSVRFIGLDGDGALFNRAYSISRAPEEFDVCADSDSQFFRVKLSEPKAPVAIYDAPAEIFVTSDPHGDFISLVSILQAGKVIDANYSWIYGSNHLVINGDIFDRGTDVLPIFWLVYKLEQEALAVGGVVHFIIGNHEEMVLRGNLKYVEQKYDSIVKQVGGRYDELFLCNSELGKWIRSRNFIERIGNYLFVHAGISQSYLDKNLTIDETNHLMRRQLGQKPVPESLLGFLFGSNGPVWYRGMVGSSSEKFEPFSTATLAQINARYNVSAVIVGHTIFDEITLLHGGRVIAVNVDNAQNRLGNKSRALLIRGAVLFKVYDSGDLLPLE